MTTQTREPPAFQEYAADILARRAYRAMSLAERGLFHTIRLECWVNRTVPANPEVLARILGYSLTEIQAALPAVLQFFTVTGDDLFCAELDAYRANLANIKNAKIDGGKRGAAITNKKRWKRGEAHE